MVQGFSRGVSLIQRSKAALRETEAARAIALDKARSIESHRQAIAEVLERSQRVRALDGIR